MKQIPLDLKIFSFILTPRNRNIGTKKIKCSMLHTACPLAKVKSREIKKPNMVQKYNIRSMTCCLKLKYFFAF